MTNSDLRFPIGPFAPPKTTTPATRAAWIEEIAAFPAALRAVVESLTEAQLETPYRPDGWTVRQVIHHVCDSHMNSLVRFKWSLTEDRPTIKAYDEAAWAELPDYRFVPIPAALAFLDTLHARWVVLLGALTDSDYRREFIHPDSGVMTLGMTLNNYAWHGRHHLAHITALISREGWR